MPTGYRKKRLGLVLDGSICDYGCGRLANFQFGNGKVCCSGSASSCFAINTGNKTWNKDFGSWNAGLTKENDFRVAEASRKKSKTFSNRVRLDLNVLCQYGCGQQAFYRFNNGKVCCSDSYASCAAMKSKASERANRPERIERLSERMKGENNPAKQFGIGEKISKAKAGKKRSKETIEKVRRAKRGKRLNLSKEARARKVEAFSGKNNPMKKFEVVEKVVKKTKGQKRTSESKKKMRLSRIKVIQKQHGQVFPTYNFGACEFFKQFDIDFKTRGRYGTDGEEYYIKELGYWLDYINFDLNLIVEWDEEFHYNADGSLKEKDIQRQKEIQAYFPDFRFVRIREKFQEGMDYSFMEAGKQE